MVLKQARMSKLEAFEEIKINSQTELRDWLTEHHHQDVRVWLITYKTFGDNRFIPSGQILNELICVGWTYSVVDILDEHHVLHLIEPRKSIPWEDYSREIAQMLIENGQMKEAGLQAIEHSKALDLWENPLIPEDLQQALDLEPLAKAGYQKYDPKVKKRLIWFLEVSQTEETRKARIQRILRMAKRKLE